MAVRTYSLYGDHGARVSDEARGVDGACGACRVSKNRTMRSPTSISRDQGMKRGAQQTPRPHKRWPSSDDVAFYISIRTRMAAGRRSNIIGLTVE
jgi:hypothetical protein